VFDPWLEMPALKQANPGEVSDNHAFDPRRSATELHIALVKTSFIGHPDDCGQLALYRGRLTW